MVLMRSLMLLIYAAGAYRTLKSLKHSSHDFDVLLYWTVVAAVELYSCYLEVIVSWIPFYFHAKGIFLMAMLICNIVPRLPLPNIIFHTIIIPFMTLMHHHLDEICQDKGLFEILAVEIPKRLLMLIMPIDSLPADKSQKENQLKDPKLSDECDEIADEDKARASENSRAKRKDEQMANKREGSYRRAKVGEAGRSGGRRSMMRRFLTGDEDVSLHSHLFDLSVPAPKVTKEKSPSPKSTSTASTSLASQRVKYTPYASTAKTSEKKLRSSVSTRRQSLEEKKKSSRGPAVIRAEPKTSARASTSTSTSTSTTRLSKKTDLSSARSRASTRKSYQSPHAERKEPASRTKVVTRSQRRPKSPTESTDIDAKKQPAAGTRKPSSPKRLPARSSKSWKS